MNQFALFSVMSSPSGDLARWLEERPELCRRLAIPARVKWEIRDKLDQANINERVLFPGLDGLASWLTRYYAERRMPATRADADVPAYRHGHEVGEACGPRAGRTTRRAR